MTQSDAPTRKLTRSSSDTVIAGVAGGLAEYLHIDSTVVRIIFIILTFAGGFGVLLYVILALVIPPAAVQAEPASAFDKKVADLHEEVKQKAKEWKEQVGTKPHRRRNRSVVGWIQLIGQIQG
jgi:phage shock protein C